jgi:anti-anti-sigma factor
VGVIDITEQDRGDVHVLRAAGELDLAAACDLCTRVDAARDAGFRRVLVDLTQLDFCDSSGLRALIRAADEVTAGAGRLALIAPDEGAVGRLFTISGVREFLPVHASVDDGLAALAA